MSGRVEESAGRQLAGAASVLVLTAVICIGAAPLAGPSFSAAQAQEMSGVASAL